MAGLTEWRAGPLAVLRSLAFYAVFYLGTPFYVAAAGVAMVGSGRHLPAVVRSWSRYHRACLRHLVGIRVAVEGTPPESGVLVAVKHESFFEALDQPILFSNPAIFAKQELLRIPLWGRAAGAYGVIPVARDQGAKALRAMLTAARARAREGHVLVIFPEGTRAAHGTAPPLRSGFAGLYKMLAMPVVPVSVDSGRLYHRWWKRPGTIRIRFGNPVPAGLPRAEIETRVHAAINELNRATEPLLPAEGCAKASG